MAVSEHGILAATPDRSKAGRRDSAAAVPWRLIGFAGLILAVVGLTDVLLLWYPLRIGRPDWEFATISGSFDALPLATIGILLIVARLHVGASRLSRRISGGILLLFVLGFIGAYVLFALSFATGLGQVDGETGWILIRAGTKTTIAALAYTVLYLVMALSLFRAARKDRSA